MAAAWQAGGQCVATQPVKERLMNGTGSSAGLSKFAPLFRSSKCRSADDQCLSNG